MRHLPAPQTRAIQVLDACIGSIRDANLTQRLTEIRPIISAAEDSYATHGRLGTLYAIQATDWVTPEISATDMRRVYKSTFVKSKATRDIYGTLMSAPKNGICPLCAQRTVSQLDHYLPQSAHPTLTVTPVNLVPACSECNKAKLASQPTSAADQPFHPYFDDTDDARWLFATVKQTKPAALLFYPQPPQTWDAVKARRIVSHFRLYKLAELYASHSAVEIEDIRFSLMKLTQGSTPQDISNHLRQIAKSRAAAQINSWRRAMYEALADSKWFCSGGFQ